MRRSSIAASAVNFLIVRFKKGKQSVNDYYHLGEVLAPGSLTYWGHLGDTGRVRTLQELRLVVVYVLNLDDKL